MNSYKTECYTYFAIKGEFEPDKITDLLGLNPSKSWSMGDKRRYGVGTYDFALWEYGKCDKYEIDVYEQCLTTISELKNKINQLKEIKRMYEVEFVLEIVPTICNDDTTPAIYFNRELIEFCYLTDTEIDIDMYVVKDNED